MQSLQTGMACPDIVSRFFFFCKHMCLACYIGSVWFRTSAYTGAKQASRVPAGSKQDNSWHNDDVKDVSVLLESELIGPV